MELNKNILKEKDLKCSVCDIKEISDGKIYKCTDTGRVIILCSSCEKIIDKEIEKSYRQFIRQTK